MAGESDPVPVVVQIQPADVDLERVEDLSILFGLALVVLVAVWGAKQLLNFFSQDSGRDS